MIVTVYRHKHYLHLSTHTHTAHAVPNEHSDLWILPPRLRRWNRGAKCFLNLICPSVRETLRSSVWVGHTHIHSLLRQISVEIFCVRLKRSFGTPLAVSRCQCSRSLFLSSGCTVCLVSAGARASKKANNKSSNGG